MSILCTGIQVAATPTLRAEIAFWHKYERIQKGLLGNNDMLRISFGSELSSCCVWIHYRVLRHEGSDNHIK